MRRDDGSVSIEVAILAPVLLLLLGVVVMAGRIAEVRGAVVNAAQQAARSASLRDDPGVASVDAETTALANLAAQDVVCVDVAVEVDASRFGPGGDVAVDVTCSVDLSALAFAGLPGSRTVHASAVETIDIYRGAGP